MHAKFHLQNIDHLFEKFYLSTHRDGMHICNVKPKWCFFLLDDIVSRLLWLPAILYSYLLYEK